MPTNETIIGELTLVDLHRPVSKVVWKGATIGNVISVMIFYRSSLRRVALRLVNPTLLGLSPEDLAAMQALHADLSTNGVLISYGTAV